LSALSFAIGRSGTFPGLGGSLSFTWRAKFDSRAPSLGEPNRNRLLGGTRAVFAFANVVHFLAHEFAGLGGGGFTLAPVAASPF